MSDPTPERLGAAIECVGIQAVTDIEGQLLGDLDNWRPIGIVQRFTEEADDV